MVSHIMEVITGYTMRPNIAMALLSLDIDINNFPPQFRTVSVHILFLARLHMLRKWKGNLASNISEIMQHLNLILAYEQQIAYQTEIQTQSHTVWDILLIYRNTNTTALIVNMFVAVYSFMNI